MSYDSECEKISVAFRSLIIQISRCLKSETLEEFKCLCQDHIGPGCLENIQTFLELFALLEERDIMSPKNVNFLLHCLCLLRHIDAVQCVNGFIEKWIASKRIAEDKRHQIFNDTNESKKESVQDCSQQHSSEQTPICVVTEEGGRKDEAVPFYDGDAPSTTYSRSNAPLTSSQERFISYMAINLSSHNWQTTMRYLGIDEDIINAANYTWPHDIKRKIRETLEYWIRSGGAITKESAMAATTLAGREDLAQELNDKFPYI